MLRETLTAPPDEAARNLRDVVALSTLPAAWLGAEPVRIAESLAAALFTTLGARWVYVALSSAPGQPPVAVAQTGRYETSTALAAAIGGQVHDWAREHDPGELLRLAAPQEPAGFLAAVRPLGLDGELGVVAAGFPADAPPTPFQELLLGVAATQGAVAAQNVRLFRSLSESQERLKRVNAELDERLRSLEDASSELRNARRAALNVMEDAVDAAVRTAVSEERFRKLVSVLTDVPWTADAEGAFVSPQGAWEAYTGQPWSAHRGFGWAEALHPDDRSRILEGWMQACRERTVYESSGRAWHEPSGQYRHFVARATPLLAPDGSVREWVGCLTDVEEQRASEEALRESEERFRHMADYAPVMVWVTNSGGDYTYISQSWYQFTGTEQGSGLGMGWLASIHPDDRPGAEAAFLSANTSGAPFRVEYRLRRFDGAYRWSLDSALPRFGAGGEFLGYIGSVIDINDRKQAEEELRRASELKDELLGMVSHEFRTPLTVIIGNVDLLTRRSDQIPDEAREESMTALRTETQRLRRLVENMLLIARGDTTRDEDFEPILLQRMLPRIVEAEQRRDPTRPIRFSADEDLPPVLGSAGYLEQVIENLVTNARKYGRAGSEIDVSVCGDDAGAVVTVSDIGEELDPEQVEHFFEPFYRDKKRAGSVSGTGLGLAVCERLIGAMGGTISARPNPGGGLQVSFTLPQLSPGAEAAPGVSDG